MLAQMEGKADYDRAARSPEWATFTCFLLLWCLIYSVATIRTGPAGDPVSPRGRLAHEKNLLRSRDLVAYSDTRIRRSSRPSTAR